MARRRLGTTGLEVGYINPTGPCLPRLHPRGHHSKLCLQRNFWLFPTGPLPVGSPPWRTGMRPFLPAGTSSSRLDPSPPLPPLQSRILVRSTLGIDSPKVMGCQCGQGREPPPCLSLCCPGVHSVVCFLFQVLVFALLRPSVSSRSVQ